MSYPEYPSLHGDRVMKWDHKIKIVGSKVTDPRIHICEKCNFPIFSYGRMIPCKHVFCLDCAKVTGKSCFRCGDRVNRIEQTDFGKIFLCDDGGPKNSHDGCRRTYLSQRDLQAHINHRHKKQIGKEPVKSSKDRRTSDPRKEERSDPRRDPRIKSYPQSQTYPTASTAPPPPTAAPQSDAPHYEINQPVVAGAQEQDGFHIEHVPVRKSNLITVPLQDSGGEYHDGQAQMFTTPPAPVPPFSGSPMIPQSEHQATFTTPNPMAFPPHATQGTVIVAAPPGYGSPAGPVPQGAPPPQAVSYIVTQVDPNVVHYEGQQPMFANVTIRPPYSTTSTPVTGSEWASPAVTQAPLTGPPPANLPPQHAGIPEASSYHGQYFQ